MILSNEGILTAIREGYLEIGGLTGEENAGDEPFNTSSVDLRLASAILRPRQTPAAFDMRKPGLAAYLRANSDVIHLTTDQPLSLEPGDFVLANTEERVRFPILGDKPKLAARVEGRSGIARCGVLVHFSAPTIHAGFEGTITLEIKNLSPVTFLLYPGMYICQLIIEEVAGDVVLTPSQYRGQTSPSGA